MIVDKPIEIKYGLFLQSVLDFVILAFCVFMIVKFMNKFKKKAEDPKNKTIPTPRDIELLSEIRDLLKEKKAD